METLTGEQQRIADNLARLTEVMKTHHVSRIVGSVMSQFLDLMSKEQSAPGREKEDSNYHAQLNGFIANKDQIRTIFNEALEEAVYGNGGRKEASIKQCREESSWQEQLKVGPVNFDRRLAAARAKVKEQLKALQVEGELVMGVYDIVAKQVNAAIGKELEANSR